MLLQLYRIAGLSSSTLEDFSDLPKEGNTVFDYDQLYQQSAQKAAAKCMEDNLRCGLLMTSHSLVQRIAAMQKKTPDIFRKKEQQTARSCWQLLSRIAGKTSPFSRFTHLAVPGLTGQTPGTLTTLVRLNNQLLGQLLELLRYHPPFYQHQQITLNDTLYSDQSKYTFLLNTRNLESVQRMDPHPVLERIIDLLQKDKKWTFRQLAEVLTEEVAADREAIESYVFELAEYGLLCWQLPVEGDAFDWWTPLSKRLRVQEDDELCCTLADTLDFFKAELPKIAKGSADKREQIQRAAFQQIQAFWNKYYSIIPEMDSEKMIAHGLKRLADKSLVIKAENLFFEDTRLAIDSSPDSDGEDDLKLKMLQLVKLLPYTNRDIIRTTLHAFYQKNFNQPVSLWTFYEKALREQLPAELTAKGSASQYRFYNKKIAEKVKTAPGVVSLHRSDWDEVKNNDNATAFVSLVMPFHKDEKYHWYVDTLLSPDGRMVGRFLPLFPEEVQEQWQNFHTQQEGDQLWIANRDASFFNANVSTPLVSGKLAVPSQKSPGSEDTISITDLMVVPSSTDDSLKIMYKNKVVSILNLSTEAVSNRSGLFQFLTCFAPAIPTKQPLLKFINQHYSPDNEGIIYYPQIDFETQLILQRRIWYFPVSAIPFKNTTVSKKNYWQQLLRWKKQHQLPDCFYYTLHAQEVGTISNAKRNNHKPQYFDFYNSLAIDVFHREIKKVSYYLKVEEMLPGRKNGIQINGEDRMTEMLLAGLMADK